MPARVNIEGIPRGLAIVRGTGVFVFGKSVALNYQELMSIVNNHKLLELLYPFLCAPKLRLQDPEMGHGQGPCKVNNLRCSHTLN